MKLFNRFVKALISVLFITSFTNSLFAQTDTTLFEKIENSGSVPYNEIKDNAKLQKQYANPNMQLITKYISPQYRDELAELVDELDLIPTTIAPLEPI